MSLPVRKSCGIVDCVSFLTLASICESLPTLLTSLSPGLSPPCRLDTDGIDLLMSFLKVSLTISARLEQDVKSSDTFCSYDRAVFLERSASRRTNTFTCSHTLLTPFFFFLVL